MVEIYRNSFVKFSLVVMERDCTSLWNLQVWNPAGCIVLKHSKIQELTLANNSLLRSILSSLSDSKLSLRKSFQLLTESSPWSSRRSVFARTRSVPVLRCLRRRLFQSSTPNVDDQAESASRSLIGALQLLRVAVKTRSEATRSAWARVVEDDVSSYKIDYHRHRRRLSSCYCWCSTTVLLSFWW